MRKEAKNPVLCPTCPGYVNVHCINAEARLLQDNFFEQKDRLEDAKSRVKAKMKLNNADYRYWFCADAQIRRVIDQIDDMIKDAGTDSFTGSYSVQSANGQYWRK